MNMAFDDPAQIRIHLAQQPYHLGIDVLIRSTDGLTVADPLRLRRYTAAEFEEAVASQSLKPTVRIQYSAAQELMDQLWSMGLRPNQKVGYEGQLAATQAHLEDMRRLVFRDTDAKRILRNGEKFPDYFNPLRQVYPMGTGMPETPSE